MEGEESLKSLLKAGGSWRYGRMSSSYTRDTVSNLTHVSLSSFSPNFLRLVILPIYHVPVEFLYRVHAKWRVEHAVNVSCMLKWI